MLAAFGDCKVRNLMAASGKVGYFEIALAMDLVKEVQA